MTDSSQQKENKTPYQKLRWLAIVAFFIYLAVVCIFPLLAGKQLYIRQSRSNLAMAEATTGTGELTAQSNGVNQTFVTNIQRLEKITVLWATYNRENAGTVYVELYRQSDMSLLASQILNAADITNGYISELVMDKPLEGLAGVPLILRLSSPDAVTGNAISPMMDPDTTLEGGSLTVGGQTVVGTLCFTAEGEDYIWTGLHYWQFTAALGAVLLTALVVMLWRVKNGKNSFAFHTLSALRKYHFLIHQLVNRDFKTKYKRSVLGVLWSFLNPLLTTLVQYMIFSNLFRFDVPNYAVYLLSGVILFNFFSESCGLMLTSITGNAGLITKVYMPKYIYPLTRTLSSLINLLLAMIPLLIVTLVSGLPLRRSFLLLPIPLVCLAVFALGVGMLLSAAMVFFRDTQFLWGIVSMIWMYGTPLFYPVSIIPEQFQWIIACNPLYHFITMVRTMLIDGISPEPLVYFQCMAFALGMFAVGALVFKKTQDKFILHL
ncbi:ABC-2 type transporter [anaerobic digester metagenome]